MQRETAREGRWAKPARCNGRAWGMSLKPESESRTPASHDHPLDLLVGGRRDRRRRVGHDHARPPEHLSSPAGTTVRSISTTSSDSFLKACGTPMGIDRAGARPGDDAPAVDGERDLAAEDVEVLDLASWTCGGGPPPGITVACQIA